MQVSLHKAELSTTTALLIHAHGRTREYEQSIVRRTNFVHAQITLARGAKKFQHFLNCTFFFGKISCAVARHTPGTQIM